MALPPEPNRLHPGHLPTPFSAEDIRAVALESPTPLRAPGLLTKARQTPSPALRSFTGIVRRTVLGHRQVDARGRVG